MNPARARYHILTSLYRYATTSPRAYMDKDDLFETTCIGDSILGNMEFHLKYLLDKFFIQQKRYENGSYGTKITPAGIEFYETLRQPEFEFTEFIECNSVEVRSHAQPDYCVFN